MQAANIAIVDEYWAGDLGCTPADLRPPVPRVQIHAGGVADYAGVFVFVRDAAPVVSAPEAVARALAARAQEFTAAAVANPDGFRALLAPTRIERVIGPAWLGYCDRSCYKAPAPLGCRPLTSLDATAFQELERACLPDDWEPKGFDLGTRATFGAFDAAGTLQAASDIEIWGGRIAHFSVVARPEARGRGFGTRAMAAATERALQLGLVPQYRVLTQNHASFRIARKLGFEDYGWTMAARLL